MQPIKLFFHDLICMSAIVFGDRFIYSVVKVNPLSDNPQNEQTLCGIGA